MMKFMIVLCAVFAMSVAAPAALLPSAVTYGVIPSAGYYTASKTINVAPPQRISYAASPLIYGFQAAPTIIGSQYHAQDSLGQYAYGYVSNDGQAKFEKKDLDGSITGRYIFVDPTGKLFETKYEADEEGFKVEGDHLPVAPKVPVLPRELANAFLKAKDDFEDAKNREAPKTEASAPSTPMAPASIGLPMDSANIAMSSPIDRSGFAYLA